MKNISFLIGGMLLIIAFGVGALYVHFKNEKASDGAGGLITSFEECADAGYPILDSYPEQCETRDGRLFVQNLPEEDLKNVLTPITVRGTFVCLSHWDTSGPVTLECAFGIQDDKGKYYALRDFDPMRPGIGELSVGSYVEIEGDFIPGSHERYQSVGTILVEEISEL